VTGEVVGNCGFSAIPADRATPMSVISLIRSYSALVSRGVGKAREHISITRDRGPAFAMSNPWWALRTAIAGPRGWCPSRIRK